jgi:anti-sigma B factor antagonist
VGFSINTSVQHRDGVAVLFVEGEIDLASAGTLRQAIDDVVSGRPRGLVIDLSEVAYLDSSGVQVLVEARDSVGQGGRFAVATRGPMTTRIIRILCLDDILVLHETVDDALSAFNTGSGDAPIDEIGRRPRLI